MGRKRGNPCPERSESVRGKAVWVAGGGLGEAAGRTLPQWRAFARREGPAARSAGRFRGRGEGRRLAPYHRMTEPCDTLAFRRSLQEACGMMSLHERLQTIVSHSLQGTLPFRLYNQIPQAGSSGGDRIGAAGPGSEHLPKHGRRNTAGACTPRSCASSPEYAAAPLPEPSDAGREGEDLA